MKFLEFVQRLDELRLRYKSANNDDRYNVISHRGNVWVISDNDPNLATVGQDIHNHTGLPEPGDGYYSVDAEERPDILVGQYYPERNQLYSGGTNEVGHHPLASLEFKKLAQFLGVDVVSGQRYGRSGDEIEVDYSPYEMQGRVPDVLYHGTDIVSLGRIMRFGLMPGQTEGNWPSVGQFNYVFLAADYHKAMFHAEHKAENDNSAPVILKVKVPDPSRIRPDYDAMASLGKEDEQADELGYTGSASFHTEYNKKHREQIAKYNPNARNLPLISGVVAYDGRIPANHILAVYADLRGEMRDDEPDFIEYRMPEHKDELLQAIEFMDNYGYYYRGMETELEDEDEDEYEDEDEDESIG